MIVSSLLVVVLLVVVLLVVGGQASLVTVQEKNNQMLDHYDNAEIKTDVDRCKAHVRETLQMDRDFTPEVRGFRPSI